MLLKHNACCKFCNNYSPRDFLWTQVLKLYAWEESFLEKINCKRSKELKNLLKSRLVGALLTLVFTTLPAMVRNNKKL